MPRKWLVVSSLVAAVTVVIPLCALGAWPGVAAAAKTVWLCRPGLANDPCTPGLSTTVYSPTMRRLRVERPQAVRNPKIDCFYVYPTISDQKTTLANFNIDPPERSVALYQAARYSQYCRVFAPVYRQATLLTLFTMATETPAQLLTTLGDVRSAFQDYLAHYNHGRGIVLIGHSQGAFMLRRLIALDIDLNPTVRKRLLSAILLGGDVLVKTGQGIGGDFLHVAACRSARQLGCVIAFSTFDTPLLSNSLFGLSATPGLAVLCTNPAALGGGSGVLDPIFPTQPFPPGSTARALNARLGLTRPMPHTVWTSQPGSYTASCSSANGGNVLQITPVAGAQVPRPSPDGTWGLHLIDASIALGNLVNIVHSEAIAYAQRH